MTASAGSGAAGGADAQCALIREVRGVRQNAKVDVDRAGVREANAGVHAVSASERLVKRAVVNTSQIGHKAQLVDEAVLSANLQRRDDACHHQGDQQHNKNTTSSLHIKKSSSMCFKGYIGQFLHN